jgi:hypothetical protein
MSKYFCVSVVRDDPLIVHTVSPRGQGSPLFVVSVYKTSGDVSPSRLIVEVHPEKHIRKIFRFVTRVLNLDVYTCMALTEITASEEYASAPYELIHGRVCEAIEGHIQPRANSPNTGLTVQVDATASAPGIDGLRVLSQTREMFLEMIYVWGECLQNQGSGLGMALAIDYFIMRNNSSALPCYLENSVLIEYTVANQEMKAMSFEDTLMKLNEGVAHGSMAVAPL